MKASIYNFAVPKADDAWLLFNARTGKMLNLDGPKISSLVKNLMGSEEAEEVEIDRESLELLTRGQFVVDDTFDELAAIRSVFWSARNDAPVVITITTTLDCNLGCFYCYEERSGDSLGEHDIPSILRNASDLLLNSGKRKLHVDWYGGEPTLNLPFLEATSSQIQSLCASLAVTYSASIISNGTAWPRDVRDFIKRHRIRQVQITFDGMKKTHDQRRRFTRKSDLGRSSFEEASSLISELVNECRVDLRYNMDNRNKSEFISFVEFAVQQGWFAAKHRATLQPARVAAYTEKSRFVDRIGIPIGEFEALKKRAVPLLPMGTMEEPETISGYATPKTSVCAALSKNAIVVGADQRTYRCGLQVSEPHRAVGNLNSSPFQILSNQDAPSDDLWWDGFDPTTLASCSACSFLPICLGGCPKKQLERDQEALDAQSIYWRDNLARLICKTANIPEIPFRFGEQEQFRQAG